MTIESIQNVGFIGLGRMGTSIANNILKSGFNLVVYNRTSEKSRALVEAGAISASSPKEAAAKSDVLLTSLRDDRVLLDVVSGEEGILSGLQPNRIHIGTSTISPSLSTRLAEMHYSQGCSYLLFIFSCSCIRKSYSCSISQAYYVCSRSSRGY
ncbi:MAG: NAD(P)-binding domain-containing protein [Nitrososphaeraceae archaeon]